jgi:hypothetical protein
MNGSWIAYILMAPPCWEMREALLYLARKYVGKGEGVDYWRE